MNELRTRVAAVVLAATLLGGVHVPTAVAQVASAEQIASLATQFGVTPDILSKFVNLGPDDLRGGLDIAKQVAAKGELGDRQCSREGAGGPRQRTGLEQDRGRLRRRCSQGRRCRHGCGRCVGCCKKAKKAVGSKGPSKAKAVGP